MPGGGQKWFIFEVKSDNYGRPDPVQGTNLETILCAISPPNTWDSMTMYLFLPFQTYIEGRESFYAPYQYWGHIGDISCITKNGTPDHHAKFQQKGINSNHCLFKSLFTINTAF